MSENTMYRYNPHGGVIIERADGRNFWQRGIDALFNNPDNARWRDLRPVVRPVRDINAENAALTARNADKLREEYKIAQPQPQTQPVRTQPVAQPPAYQTISNNGVTYRLYPDGTIDNISGPIKATANPNGPGYVAVVERPQVLDQSLQQTQYGEDWRRLQELRAQRDRALLGSQFGVG